QIKTLSLDINKFLENSNHQIFEGDLNITLEQNGKLHSFSINFSYEDTSIFNYETSPIIGNGNGNGNSSLIGKWMAVEGCTNKNNERNWFQFNANGTGKSFSADCNSKCTGYGVQFYYNWTSTSNSIKLNWTSVNDYCGVSSPTPN